MTIPQVCLLVAVNVLASIFMANQRRCYRSTGANRVLVAMILLGFVLIWRPFF